MKRQNLMAATQYSGWYQHRVMNTTNHMPVIWYRVLFALTTMLIVLLGQVGCTSAEAAVPQDTGNGPRFVLELTPGASYRTTTRWFIFDMPIYPQIAVWVETPEGSYQGTIFVTAKAERNNWVSAPAAGRPEALPVWNHLKQGALDAVAAATSAGSTLSLSNLAASLPAGRYLIMLETNRSYDYNATYTAAVSGVAGQPSVIYRAELTLGSGPMTTKFEPIGTGALDGADGLIHPGLEGIDTALTLFSKMEISYKE